MANYVVQRKPCCTKLSIFKCDGKPIVAVSPELVPSSQTGVRELSPKAHLRGLELQP